MTAESPTPTGGRRTPARESLRDQQRRLARERILAATAEEIVSGGLDELSMPAVAEAAGVSLRTVYNHVESRDALLTALCEEADRRLAEEGAVHAAHTLAELPAAIRVNSPAFARLGDLGRAAAVVRNARAVSQGRVGATPGNPEMTAALRAALAEVATPPLTQAQLDALVTALRTLVGSESFLRMHQAGVDPEDAGEAIGWMVEVMVRALDAGELPFAGRG